MIADIEHATRFTLVAVAALRLMAGPVDLDFLKSRLAQDFNLPDTKVTIHADRPIDAVFAEIQKALDHVEART